MPLHKMWKYTTKCATDDVLGVDSLPAKKRKNMRRLDNGTIEIRMCNHPFHEFDVDCPFFIRDLIVTVFYKRLWALDLYILEPYNSKIYFFLINYLDLRVGYAVPTPEQAVRKK